VPTHMQSFASADSRFQPAPGSSDLQRATFF
jgi:hypothetical protein